MPPILRLSSSLRPSIINSFREQKSQMLSNFFTRSHSPAGLGLRNGPQNTHSRVLPPSLRRPYSSRSNYSSGGWQSHPNRKYLRGFIGVNAAVFAYCKYVEVQAQQGFRKPYLDFFKNFTLNFNGVFDGGRYWTLLTSVFTHMSFMHMLGNMVSFYYMGRLVAETPGIGPTKLATLVIGSGLTGSLGYLFNRQQSMQQNHTNIDNRYGLGFSGAVMGVGSAAACMYPTQRFALYGLVPVPLWVLMSGYFLYDAFYLKSSENTRVGHAGHLGGLAFGIGYYFLSIRTGLFRGLR